MTKKLGVKIKRISGSLRGLFLPRFKILAWHSVALQSRDPYEVSEDMFRRQMEILAEENYSVISLEHALSSMRSGHIPNKSVVITFDDGYRKLQDYAFPLLELYRFPATVFVPFNYVGGIDVFSYREPRPNFEILSMDEMKVSQRSGISYGSHTMRHVDLTCLIDKELNFELSESRKILSEELDVNFFSLAYPFGMFDERVKRAVAESGYECALCFGNIMSNSRHTGSYEMKREKILEGTELSEFKVLLEIKNDFLRKTQHHFPEFFKQAES